MIGGIHGKILHINLNDQSFTIEQPAEDIYKKLAGGRGLIAYFLLRDTPEKTDALDPDNLLIFAPGLLQGTNFPGAGRHAIGGKSPLTGAIGASEAGGFFGHELKRTGFDAIVIKGKSEKPVYLWIHNGQIEFRDAAHLWGKMTADTQKIIRNELNDQKIRVAQIGPAGENLVRFASVMNDINRAAGRNGLGAVMGSKNLKAVALKGTIPPIIANPDRLKETTSWLLKNYKELSAWATSPTGRGTQGALLGLGKAGALPTRNFSQAEFEYLDELSGERNYEMFFKERDTCQGCPIACKSTFENKNPDPNKDLDPVYGGAEYEAMAAFGPICLVKDNLAVLKANELSNAYGLDSISTGMVIAFVMECFENGILTEADTGGLTFNWGDPEILVNAVRLIAERKNFGDFMADGVDRMSKKLGSASEPFNITVKGQELPMHEPRLKTALGIGYAVSPIGADHMINIHDPSYAQEGPAIDRVNSVSDIEVSPVSPFELNENKMHIFYHEVNFQHFQDCALSCFFFPYDYAHLSNAISAVTGVEFSIKEILAVGERAQTLSRLFNVREGFSSKDDRVPARLFKAFDTGPLQGKAIDIETFNWALKYFYSLMDWNPESGIPTSKSIERLGLAPIISEK